MSDLSRKVLRGVLALLLATVAGVVVTVGAPPPGGAAPPACTTTWTDTSGGSWDTGSGWSGGTVPAPTDHVCITTPGTYAVSIPDPGSAVTVASLTLGAATGTGAQTVAVDRPLTVAGDLTTDGDGVLRVGDDLRVTGTLWTKGGQVRGDGVVEVLHGQLRVGEADTDPAAGAPSFVLDGGTFGGGNDDRGKLRLESDSPIAITTRGTVRATDRVFPGQTITVQGADGVRTSLSFPDSWAGNGGRIVLQPSEEGDVEASTTATYFRNDGVLERSSADGAAAIIRTGGAVNTGRLVANGGVIEVTGNLSSVGEIELGFGEIVVGSILQLALDSTVSLAVRAGGDPDVGRIRATGLATVDGVLHVTTPSADLAPAVGSYTPVVIGFPRSGTFDELRFAGPASYDAQHAHNEVRIWRIATGTATRRFVRAAFQDFLDRQPTEPELVPRAAAIDGGTLTRAALVRQLSLSDEYLTALVDRFYTDTLGRPGEPAGVAYWVDRLRTGRNTVAEVAGSFYASAEFHGQFTSDQAWLRHLYGLFFGRPPTQDDLVYWSHSIHERGRTRVAVELFQSLESRRQRVERFYQELLHRAGDPGGVDYWAGRITREGDLALAVSLASSGEYLALAQQRYP